MDDASYTGMRQQYGTCCTSPSIPQLPKSAIANPNRWGTTPWYEEGEGLKMEEAGTKQQWLQKKKKRWATQSFLRSLKKKTLVKRLASKKN